MDKRVQEYMNECNEMNKMMKHILNGGSYAELIEKSEVLLTKMREAVENSQAKYNNLRAEIDSKEGPETNYHKLQEKKKETINADQEKIDQYEDLAKSRLDTIKFKTLHKVKRTREVEDLFKFFFLYLYFEHEKNYSFGSFVSFALKKGVKEFKKRLAKFDVLGMEPEGLALLEKVRGYNYEDNKSNSDLMELLEWLDYKNEAYLQELTLKKHLEISRTLMANKHYQKDETDGLKVLASEHQILIHSLNRKIETLKRLVAVMSSAEGKGKEGRNDTEEAFESAQFKVEKVGSNETILKVKQM